MKNFIIKKLAFWFRSYAQKKNNVTVERILLVTKKIMKSQKYCFLSTFENGEIFSRVLQPFPPTDDFLVYFGTSPDSKKIQQIKTLVPNIFDECINFRIKECPSIQGNFYFMKRPIIMQD